VHEADKYVPTPRKARNHQWHCVRNTSGGETESRNNTNQHLHLTRVKSCSFLIRYCHFILVFLFLLLRTTNIKEQNIYAFAKKKSLLKQMLLFLMANIKTRRRRLKHESP
jgi:hypothetical protein